MLLNPNIKLPFRSFFLGFVLSLPFRFNFRLLFLSWFARIDFFTMNLYFAIAVSHFHIFMDRISIPFFPPSNVFLIHFRSFQHFHMLVSRCSIKISANLYYYSVFFSVGVIIITINILFFFIFFLIILTWRTHALTRTQQKSLISLPLINCCCLFACISKLFRFHFG